MKVTARKGETLADVQSLIDEWGLSVDPGVGIEHVTDWNNVSESIVVEEILSDEDGKFYDNLLDREGRNEPF